MQGNANIMRTNCNVSFPHALLEEKKKKRRKMKFKDNGQLVIVNYKTHHIEQEVKYVNNKE